MGGVVLVLALLALALTLFTGKERFVGIAVSALGLLIAAMGFLRGRCSETLNECGITVKTAFSEKVFPWSAIRSVEILPPGGKDLPKILLIVEGRKMALMIDYTKQTAHCVSCYYGKPDKDRWGKPPTVT